MNKKTTRYECNTCGKDNPCIYICEDNGDQPSSCLFHKYCCHWIMIGLEDKTEGGKNERLAVNT